MCTVTYLPLGGNHFVITSNRDEQPARSPKRISIMETQGMQLCFPQDTSGGSWIAISNTNRVVCLLNGAFEKHHHEPPYKRSRGLMLLDFFEFPNAEKFFSTYDFEGMEPFTMIIVDDGKLFELRWDEKKIHQTKLDHTTGFLWSSATLYDASVKKKRQGWFEQWKGQHQNFSPESILRFHQTAGDGDPWNDVIMNRAGIVRTVSITQVIKSTGQLKMDYHDLLNGQFESKTVHLRTKMVDFD
ncbi:MAG: hypothetical protein DHS20C18_47850 [Saprospiraceae bacterium]|nr:MAG: hypothetical protein DHS20C18_47850 [Saprospiraceae bacterium]